MMVEKSLREAYGDEIIEIGRKNPDIWVVDADVGKSCLTLPFAHELPGQYVNCGIAEQGCAAMAAGLATCGKIPFITTYAVFGSMRMLEMIRQEICYPNLNVKIACSHGGLTPADDGASHQAPEDMGILRTIPNMRVVMGADYWATRKLIREAAKIEGPVYLRFTKGPIKPVYDEDVELTIGKANMLRDGKDVAIIANGDTVNIAVSAAGMLEEKGISARVLDMHTIKPLDVEAVTDCLVNIGKVITVEDAYIINGLGSAVSEVCAGMGKGIVKRIGVQDWFGQSGPYDKLLEINGITKEDIVKTAEELLK